MELTEQFLSEVRNHAITVEMDFGRYRSIKFSNPESNHLWFRLVSYPSGLVITSDVGAYSFGRTTDKDMFRALSIPSLTFDYFHHKLVSRDARCDLQEFCPIKYKAWLEEFKIGFQQHAMHSSYNNYQRHEETEEFNDLVQALELAEDDCEMAISEIEGGCHIPWVRNYIENGFLDISKPPYQWLKYGDEFLWCCQAVQWGIKQYSESPERWKVKIEQGPIFAGGREFKEVV